MKTKKLSMADFDEVGVAELLEVKGGYADYYADNYGAPRDKSGPGGGKECPEDPWGNPWSMSELTVYGMDKTNTPMMQQAPPPATRNPEDCPPCDYERPGEMNSSRNWQAVWSWYSHALFNNDGAHGPKCW